MNPDTRVALRYLPMIPLVLLGMGLGLRAWGDWLLYLARSHPIYVQCFNPDGTFFPYVPWWVQWRDLLLFYLLPLAGGALLGGPWLSRRIWKGKP